MLAKEMRSIGDTNPLLSMVEFSSSFKPE
jgi:hypothetical protein